MPPNPSLRSSNDSSALRRYWRIWRMYIGHRGCLPCSNSLAASLTASPASAFVAVRRASPSTGRSSRVSAPLRAGLRREALDGRRVVGHGLAERRVAQLDEHAASRLLQRDDAALGDLLDEVAERAGAVVALGERRVELQQRALEEPELRRDFAIRQHLQRALHERQRLLEIRRCGDDRAARTRASAGRGPARLRQRGSRRR